MLQRYDERNRDIVVNINGKLMARDEAGVSPFDSSVQNGDAVWEGLRLYRGRIFRLGAHLARLRKGARALAYEGFPSDDEIRRELRRTLEANGMTDGVHVRLTVSRGVKFTSGMDPRVNAGRCTLIIIAEHKAPVYDASAGVRLITSRLRRPGPETLDQTIHSCNQLTSILAKMEATSAGADDALMLDTRGFLAETNATHLFLVKAGGLMTPTTVACPEGITRGAVMDLCRENGIGVMERDIEPREAHEAEEMFCTGTMGEIAPVVTLDGRAIGAGSLGALTVRMMELFRALVEREAEEV